MLQEGILCDVFSQKCSAAWQGARGERLTVAIMLPGRQDADDWLNFMLSQKNLWPTFTTRGTLTEEVSEQVFSKERRRLQAKHLWMEVKLRWRVLVTECTPRLPLGSPKKNSMLCFLRGLPGATTRIRMKKNHIVVLQSKKSKHGGNNAKIGWHTSKDKMRRWSSTSRVLKALSGKEAEAQSEVDAFMEHCVKRWQTREGTYQLKRRRLKPDVRDRLRI